MYYIIMYYIIMYYKVPLSYDLTTFQSLGQKFVKFFVGILVQTMTPKGHLKLTDL